MSSSAVRRSAARHGTRTQPQAQTQQLWLVTKKKTTPTPLTYSLGRPRLGLNLLRSDTKPLACEYVNFFLTFLHHRNSPSARDSASRSKQSHQILQSLNSVRARACLCMCHHSFHSRDRTPNFFSLVHPRTPSRTIYTLCHTSFVSL